MKLSLKDQPRERKILIVNKLRDDLNQSIAKIIKLTGLSARTVSRYLTEDPPKIQNYEEYWQEYDNAIKKIWKEQDAEIVALATNRIVELLPKAPLYQAIGAFKTVRDVNMPVVNTNGKSNVNVAVQIVEGPTKKTYNSNNESKETDQAQSDDA